MKKLLYSIAEECVEVVSESSSATEVLACLLQGFRVPEAEESPTRYEIRGSGPFEILSEGRRRFRSESAHKLGTKLEWTIVQDALSRCPHVVIHAAAVAFEDTTLLIAGHPGAGKTTLALGLAVEGGKLFTDEATLLSASKRIIPFPRVIRAKGNTLELVQRLGSASNSASEARRTRHFQTRVLDSAMSPVSAHRALRMVIRKRLHGLSCSPNTRPVSGLSQK